ncbi:MAG: DHHA1 domain-containing protein [Candidatus Bathyarchaeia archaeon]
MIILTHGDCDGVCSAAIVKMLYPHADVYFTNPSKLLPDLKKFNTPDALVVCDIALNEGEWLSVEGELRRISQGFEAVYIDHHQLPVDFPREAKSGVKIYHREDMCASQIVYAVYSDRMEERTRRWAAVLATYGAISDYTEDTPPASELLNMVDKRVLYLESGVLSEALAVKHDDSFKKAIIEDLTKGIKPSQIPKLVDYAVEALKLEYEVYSYVEGYTRRVGDVAVVMNLPHKGFLGKAAIYSIYVSGASIGCAIALKEKTAELSLRTRDPKINLGSIVRKVAKTLGGRGGGHNQACGAEIPEDAVEDFIRMVNSLVSRGSGSL